MGGGVRARDGAAGRGQAKISSFLCITTSRIGNQNPFSARPNLLNVIAINVWSLHIARVCINWVRLPILLVVSSTGKMNISLSAFAPKNLASRDGFGSPVPRQPAHLYTRAESGAYLQDSSRVPRRRPCAVLAGHHGPNNMRLSVPQPLLVNTHNRTGIFPHIVSNRWRTIISWVHKIRLQGRRGKGTAKSFS